MLNEFNLHADYLTNCVFLLYRVVMNNPEMNNYWDINDAMYNYFSRVVQINRHKSKQICSDCSYLVNFFYDEEYINIIKASFENDDDAYHYLAIIAQVFRISNKHMLRSSNSDEVWDYSRMIELVLCS